MTPSRAKIIATIGPASQDKEVLGRLVDAGLDVARLNFSWGEYVEHARQIDTLRTLAVQRGKQIPIIQDLAGPRTQDESGHRFDTHTTGALTEKDLRDLDFGAAQGLDFVALSFVGNAGDVEVLREAMRARGMHQPIIAKIERAVALQHLPAIIEAADVVMVARGDLGREIPLEHIPYVQRDILEQAQRAGKPVIVATQMMESMVEHPEPTRAEVADVTQALLDGASAVMLSEETALGKYPQEATAMMERIADEALRRGHAPPHPLFSI